MNNKQPEAKQVITTTKKVELVNAKSTTKNTNPLVVKIDKKLLETKNKQIASARRIQQFWRDGRNRLKWKKTAEGLRNKQKENFASGVLLVMLMLQVAAGLIKWYTGIGLINVVMVVNYYLLMLVWASTLPIKSTWQLKIGNALPPFLLIMNYLIHIDLLSIGDWFVLFLIVPSIVLAYRFFISMTTTLKHTYAADIHGLSARLSTKIIAGLPILCYLGMNMISSEFASKYIKDDLCHYVPGAYWDKNYTSRTRMVNGRWMNCTDSEQFDRYYPDTPNTVNEVMLEQEMNAYVANQLKWFVAQFQMLELTILLLTSQVLLRVCRLTVNDILSLRVSGWELSLSIVTLIRVASIMVMGGLNLEMFKFSNYRNVSGSLFSLIMILHIVALGIIIKLVRDAAAVIRLEKNPKAKQLRSKSVEIIHKRRPRQSVMQRQKIEDIV
tara:strand:+ start:3325 stop:4644 length:1320 start_codon:yes stop_codon:yes gene_type:complete